MIKQKSSGITAKKRFDSLDGLRAFSAIGIVIMHIQANAKLSVDGFLYNTFIPDLTNLVYLFMIVSAFSMFCGYYDKFQTNSININDFYKRRYTRILPYFGILVLIEMVLSHSIKSVIEGFMDLTLVFGLLPNNSLSVIGVGWFLGVVFLFYLMFPFFCFLLKKKSFAWFSLIVTIAIHYCCELFLFNEKNVVSSFTPRHNLLFCMMYFIAGGIIYLYKDSIIPFVHKFRFLVLALILGAVVLFFFIRQPLAEFHLLQMYYLILFSSILIYAISNNGIILTNPIVKFLSGISMEIYLSHMVIYRLCEKLNLIHLFGNSWLNYIFICIVILGLTVVFAFCLKKIIEYVMNYFTKKSKKA